MTSHSRQPKMSHTQSGFALVLVLGILLVAAAVTATLVARQENETVWAPIEGTQTQMASVEKAIAAYERKNHRLPLPAVRVAEKGMVLHVEATSLITEEMDAGKGSVSKAPAEVAEAIADGATAVTSDGGVSFASNPSDPDNVIVIGAIPTETLGLPREAAEDSYGRLLTYAVTLASTNPFTYDTSEGAIELEDAKGNAVASKLTYIVLAHGKEGAGAWNAKSRFKGKECDGGMVEKSGGEESGGTAVSDQANCDENDATFIMNDVTLVAGDTFFDDQIVKGEKDKVALTSGKPCPSQTVTWGPGNVCSGVLPEPGIMHTGSNQEPREIEFLVGQVMCPPVVPGQVSPSCTTGGPVLGRAVVTCNNGVIVVSEPTCTVKTDTCALPWGGHISVGDSVEAWTAGTYPCGAPGPASEMRECVDNGDGTTTLTGSNTHGSVTPPVCSTSCNLPWGGTINIGDSVEAWAAGTYPCGAPGPSSEMRECVDNGDGTTTLTGGNMFGSTQSDPNPCPTSCTTPWGDTVEEGESVTAFMHQDCESKAACTSETRTCTAGVLSGSYTQEKDCRDHCPVATNCVTPWSDGLKLNTGQTVTSYGPYDSDEKGGGTCDEQIHTCQSDGSFDVSIGGRTNTCEATCVSDGKGGCEGDDDGVGEVEVLSCMDHNNVSVLAGECGMICSEDGMLACMSGTAAVPARCSGAVMTADPSCADGGGGK